jgi:hypothetical protein
VNKLIKVAERYLKKNIDSSIRIKPWNRKNIMPIFLRNMYDFHEMTILREKYIIIEIINDIPDVNAVKKHIDRIEALTGKKAVLLYKKITRYRRNSLIENRIPFIIENGQIYLPFLGVILNNKIKSINDEDNEEDNYFPTSTQLSYLYFLYNKEEVINTTDFSKKMNFTKMTASRALNDLYDLNLLTYEVGGKTGRSKEYKRIADPEYFIKGIDYVKSPIGKIVYVKQKPIGTLYAGLDALAKQTMLNLPDYTVVAMGKEVFKNQDIEIIKNKDIIKDKKLTELQIWDYDPREFSDKNYVDTLSLYASLKEDKDERIEQALEEVLRGEPWYTD